MKFDKIKWDSFPLNEFFEISSSNYQIDKINLNLSGEKKYPYITRSEKNNGISDFISHQGLEPNNGNVIIIGLDTQTVFYQQMPFYTGQNIQIVRSTKINNYVAMFLVPLIKKQMEKFNWGGNGATLTRLKKINIMLPINQENEPDWGFMESYAKSQFYKIKNRVSFTTQNAMIKPKSLTDVNWGEFKIEQLFKIKSGVRLTKKEMKKGDYPFIGATDSNNGITAFISNKNRSMDRNVLGVNYNGSVVETFYHPYTCLFSDDVKRLHLKNKLNNKYVLLFLKNMIYAQKKKYAYGYKFNSNRMKRQIILVPIDNQGNPDWDFMEQYMKYKESKILKSYFTK